MPINVMLFVCAANQDKLVCVELCAAAAVLAPAPLSVGPKLAWGSAAPCKNSAVCRRQRDLLWGLRSRCCLTPRAAEGQAADPSGADISLLGDQGGGFKPISGLLVSGSGAPPVPEEPWLVLLGGWEGWHCCDSWRRLRALNRIGIWQ